MQTLNGWGSGIFHGNSRKEPPTIPPRMVLASKDFLMASQKCQKWSWKMHMSELRLEETNNILRGLLSFGFYYGAVYLLNHSLIIGLHVFVETYSQAIQRKSFDKVGWELEELSSWSKWEGSGLWLLSVVVVVGTIKVVTSLPHLAKLWKARKETSDFVCCDFYFSHYLWSANTLDLMFIGICWLHDKALLTLILSWTLLSPYANTHKINNLD